jgi:hypothetical protein
MKEKTLSQDEQTAAKEAAIAITKAQWGSGEKAVKIARGFMGRRRADATKVLIAIEGFLYDSDNAGHRPQDGGAINKETKLPYTDGRRTYGKGKNEFGNEVKLKYKLAEDEKNADIIEKSDFGGEDLAIAVMEFLQAEKLQPETPEEAAKALELEKDEVNTPARGKQMILRAEDITQEDVTRALKGIASNIDRLAKEEELRQEATKLKIMNARIEDEGFRGFSALFGVELYEEEESLNGYDVESLNSWHEAIRNESELSSVNGSGGASSKSSTRSTQSASIKSVRTTANKSRLPSFGGAGSAISETLIQRTPSNSSEFVDRDFENEDANDVILNNLNRLTEKLRRQINDLTDRYDALFALQKKEAERVGMVETKLEQHLVDQNPHPNSTTGVGLVGGGAGIGVNYSRDLEEIKKKMGEMLDIQKRVEVDLSVAKEAAAARELQAKKEAEERDLKAKKEAEERDLKAQKEYEEKLKTLSEDQKREFEALRKQAADHQAAEKKAREEKEARELAEKARRDDRSWPIRISQVELRTLGHYDSDSGQDCKIPEISGRIRESDKTMELYESGLSVAIYDFGKRGLTYLGHDVDAAGNAAAFRESKMTIAKVIDPNGDGKSADVYCVISSSPERGMSTTYISESTFQDIALKSHREYENAALATAKLVELKKALEVLEAARVRVSKEMASKDDDDDNFSTNDDDNFSTNDDDDNFSTNDDDDNFSTNDEQKADKFSKNDPLHLASKIEALKKIIDDTKESLDPKSKKAEDDRVKREEVIEILSEYHSGVRKVFEAVRTFDASSKDDWYRQIKDAKDNLKNDSGDRDLHGTFQKKLSSLGLFKNEIDEILGSDDLINRIDSLKSGEVSEFYNFGQNLQRSREFVEDLYPTRSHALKRAAQYSLKKEFGDLDTLKYQDSDGSQKSVLTNLDADTLKSAITNSSDTKKCLANLTVAEKDNARRVASTEFSRNAAREIEEANKEKLDFSEFEKQAATEQLAQHWKNNRFFTSSNALASKETDVKDFFEKAKMSDSPYPGLQYSRPNRRNDIATVVFNGLNRFDPESEAGYEGDDMMYLHVRGTVAPNVLYVRVCLATGDGGNNIKAYKDGKETDKTFKYGDIIMDESTAYTKDSSGIYHAKGVSSLSKVDQGLCNNFKVKAMSVIDGERKTAILFEGVPIAPQNGITKVAQVKEVPVIVLAKMTPLISLVTKKRADKKGKEISDGGIYVQDASDPDKPLVLTDPLWNDKQLAAELAKHGVTENIPTCESLKTKMNPPRSIFKTNSAKPIGLNPDLTNLSPPPIKGSRGQGGRW